MSDAPSNPGTHEREVPAWLLDVLLGLAVSLVIAIVISARQGGQQAPDAVAYGFAGAFGALMLARRHYPVAVLIATMLVLFGYYILGYPAIGLAVPVAAALYSASEQGRVAASISVSGCIVLVSTYFRLQDGESLAYLLGYELVSTAALMAAAIALGDSTRSRRALRSEQAHITRLIEQEHARRAEQHVQTERISMARDLHDVIGHSMSVIALHADVAREAIGRDDVAASQALGHVRTAASQALRELRALVRLLRNPETHQADQSAISLAHLATLIENAHGSGLHVELDLRGTLDHLPATVDSAAYRIVQESLTNVIRHAHATAVVIAISLDEGTLQIDIRDNGTAAPGELVAGNGIAGMRERARLLGGTLNVRQAGPGGVQVYACLPIGGNG